MWPTGRQTCRGGEIESNHDAIRGNAVDKNQHMPKFKTNIPILVFVALAFALGGPSREAFSQNNNGAVAQDSPLLREPDSPEALFEAVDLMVRLARPELAKRYLVQLVESDPSEETLLKLKDTYGTALFLRFSTMESLQPESQQLLEKLNVAARKQAEDPARTQQFIDDLIAGGVKREQALIMLKNLGAPVVPMLLQRLSMTSNEVERTQLLQAIIHIGPEAIPVLHGGATAPGEALQQVSIEALGWLEDRTAVPLLWYPAFGTRDQPAMTFTARTALMRIFRTNQVSNVEIEGLAAELNRLTQLHLSNRYHWALNPNQKVAMWLYDPTAELLRPSEVDPEEASLILGAHFASQALRVSPENNEVQATFLALALARDFSLSGWDRPLPTGPGTAHDLALTSGPGVLGDALHIAIENANTLAALASLQALSQVASPNQLQMLDSRKSSILTALNYPSPRVQFAAANTVLQIDPERKFPGCDRVVDILARAISDSRMPHALVVDADPSRADRWATMLNDQGYRSQSVRTGREGFRVASERVDVQLIVVHANCIDWVLSQTLLNLRADARTAAIPIVIYGPRELEFRLEGTLERTSHSRFLTQDVDAAYLDLELNKFLRGLGTPDLTPELRTEQVSSAAYWFAQIASSQRTGVYDLSSAEEAILNGTNDPAIARHCLIALSAIPSKNAQKKLLENAVDQQQQLELRKTAAFQLTYHIQRHSWLLNGGDLQSLNAAYQREVEENSEMATSLAAVLGTLKPNSKLVGDRLQGFQSTR